ncbi:hypothetical protein MVEN_01450200 [Mycena venus]|uniref:Uncharacterized protein n=1 Tax=Mycena venus TaxID=2733690 RepID=A0A8H7CQY7_9AGAR|nr:hypothetical protein MVEN_01450200 [Mycena venus]
MMLSLMYSTFTGSQCAAPGGLKLLTKANWHRLTVDPKTLLKGKLKDSPTVTASFSAATKDLQKPDDLGPWIAGIFDVKKTPGAWDGWEPDMSYCQPCLMKFLEDHVWVWYLNYRIQKGWVPPENCTSGYNCKKIMDSRDHVFAKNHLCAPTKSEEMGKPTAPPESPEMSQTNVPPLGDDIIGRIMALCPTFDTLQSTARTFFKSITWAVAHSVIGPAVPQAVRVVRYPYYDRNTNKGWRIEHRDPDLMAAVCPEGGATLIMTQDALKLVENAKVISAFENIYSLTQKDRTSRTSVLTPQERWRFQRAAYRIMLYCNMFPGTRYDLDELADMEQDIVKAVQRQRTAVLREYPTDELLEVYAVARFMRDVLEGIKDNAAEDVVDTLLATGPCGVVRAWEARSLEDVPDELYWLGKESDDNNTLYTGYFDIPFAQIWSARKCAAPAGLKLLTEANWHRLAVDPKMFLKGKLKDSPTITAAFTAATEHLQKSGNLSPWIAGMFNIKQTSGPWDGWERDMSYCQPCLTKFLEDHVWVWYLNECVQKGAVPVENCWYGYNCKTMVHNRKHAVAKNHLCIPTQGDV